VRTAGPWRAGDRRTFAWTTGLGLAGLVIGYWGASGTVAQSTQLRWTALAVAGVAVAGLGNAVWLAAAARDVRARRGQMSVRLSMALAGAEKSAQLAPPGARDYAHLPRAEGQGAAASTAGGGSGVGVVTAEGMTHYHRPDCLMVVGKTVREGTGRKRPCPICRPG